MFGYPAYYAGKKLSICIYELGVALKIPEKTALAVDENVVPFQPMGKPKMKVWVHILLTDPEDYRRYEPIFWQSIVYLLEQQSIAS